MNKILVIDDDPKIRDLYCYLLQNKGYKVFMAEDGKKGMRIFNSHQPDLVVTDIVMPEKDGFEIILEVRRISRTIPILAVTGNDRLGPNLEIAKMMGASACWKKSCRHHELLTTVESLLAES